MERYGVTKTRYRNLNSMKQLKELFLQTNYIKEEFKKVETGTWTPKEFGTELIVQSGHLADIILRQSVKYNSFSINENNKHLGDEMSDVLLNTFSIILTSGLSSDDLEKNILKTVGLGKAAKIENWKQIGKFGVESCLRDHGNSQVELNLFKNIVKDSTELFSLTREEQINKENVLKTAARLTINTFALGYFMELDLPDFFNKMIEESKIFVDKKSKSITESYPYKTDRIKISIDESALPFLEKPRPLEGLSEEVPLPFMLLRSSGFPWKNEIREKIIREGFEIDHERKTDEFELLARYIYPAHKDMEETYLWFALSRKAFPNSYNKGHAFVLSEREILRYGEIDSLKRRIRASIGPTPFDISYRGKKILTDLHHIHAPDEKDYKTEYKYLASLSYRVDIK